jgi:hypothetical protein
MTKLPEELGASLHRFEEGTFAKDDWHWLRRAFYVRGAFEDRRPICSWRSNCRRLTILMEPAATIYSTPQHRRKCSLDRPQLGVAGLSSEQNGKCR